MSDSEKLSPSIVVIFGITGDLSRRFLLPALYHLCKDNLLPEPTVIIGTSRQKLDLDEFLGHVQLCVLEQDKVCDPEVLKQLRSKLELVQLDPTEKADYDKLAGRLDDLEKQHGLCLNRLYYLSIPPQIYGPVVRNLGASKLNGSCSHGVALTRLLVEKPFGFDVTSAEDLIKETSQHFSEAQLFRIDHYLAKEIAQDILPFRRHNPELEKLWNSEHIDRIEIIATETLDIEGRQFYDQIGAMRDLVQSHLLQLMALTTMELPDKLTSQAVHDQKAELLKSIQIPAPDTVTKTVVRGQYEGYRQAVGNDDSTTETFVSLRLELPTKRWQGTDFLLTTGKALDKKCTEVNVKFKNGDSLCFQISPDGKIETDVEGAVTDVSENQHINHDSADAYEHVIINAIRGDHALFATSAEVLAGWHILQPILDTWTKDSHDLKIYQPGSAGPDLKNLLH